jgi:hypothetical protein
LPLARMRSALTRPSRTKRCRSLAVQPPRINAGTVERSPAFASSSRACRWLRVNTITGHHTRAPLEDHDAPLGVARRSMAGETASIAVVGHPFSSLGLPPPSERPQGTRSSRTDRMRRMAFDDGGSEPPKAPRVGRQFYVPPCARRPRRCRRSPDRAGNDRSGLAGLVPENSP